MKNPQAKTSWKIKRFRRELVSYTSLVDIGALNSQSETCAHPSVHVCFSILIPFRDWCANPGKRKRRRHRKSRYSESTVGFVELSRMVAARWAELDTVDPETFNFVHELAAEKRREMYQHNRMIAASGSNALFENKMYRKKSQVGSKRRPGSSSSMRTRTNKSFTKNKLPFYKNTDLEVDLCEKCTSESVVPTQRPSSVTTQDSGHPPFGGARAKRIPCSKRSPLAPSSDMVDIHDNDILQMWQASSTTSS